jgi:hypothetical protein
LDSVKAHGPRLPMWLFSARWPAPIRVIPRFSRTLGLLSHWTVILETRIARCPDLGGLPPIAGSVRASAAEDFTGLAALRCLVLI